MNYNNISYKNVKNVEEYYMIDIVIYNFFNSGKLELDSRYKIIKSLDD